MLKTISIGKLITLPKFKMKKNGRVYDKEWNTWFSCEQERQDFISAIEEAENDTISYTQEEVDEIFEKEFGII